MQIVKIGSVELTPEEAEKYYSEGKYIVTYGCIYQLFYSAAQKKGVRASDLQKQGNDTERPVLCYGCGDGESPGRVQSGKGG